MDRERFVALDSWRGICALVVVLFHYPVWGWIHAQPIIENGYLFVDFFFVLSGFVIVTAYGDRLDSPRAVGGFLLRRFGRLWPLHLTLLAVFVAIALARRSFNADDQHSAHAVVTNLLMIHGLGVEPGLTWNSPSWSISVEWFLYLTFALVAAAPYRPVVYVALAALGAAVLILKAPFHAASTYDYGFFRGLAGFFVGALLTYLPRLRRGLAAEAAAAGVAVAFVIAGRWLFLAPLVFALVVYVFAGSDGLLSRALRWRPCALIGEWSYSLYMVHTLVVAAIWNLHRPLGFYPIQGGGHLGATLPREIIGAAAYLAVTIALSWLTFSLVEQPGRRWFNRLAVRRFSSAPVALQAPTP
jgi:peptidoglycan/LPS O-acetylase OafA/YrhL